MRNWIQSNSQSVSRALLMFIVLINLRGSEGGGGWGAIQLATSIPKSSSNTRHESHWTCNVGIVQTIRQCDWTLSAICTLFFFLGGGEEGSGVSRAFKYEHRF